MKVLGDTQTIYFILDEPSEMMKKEAKSLDDLKKLAEAKQDRDLYKNKPSGCQVKTEKMD